MNSFRILSMLTVALRHAVEQSQVTLRGDLILPAVLKLVEYTARDTISVLKVLLKMAQDGELRGIAVCYRSSSSTEHSAFTGLYRMHPEAAAAAFVRAGLLLAPPAAPPRCDG